MNTPFTTPRAVLSHPRRRDSFTLVELVVSMAILSIMLLALATMMAFVIQTWLAGINSVNNFTKARTMLSMLDRDGQMMVMRPDLAAFADNNTAPIPVCAFYTKVQGQPGVDTRALSLVQYSLVQLPTPATATSSVLERLNYGMNFTPTTGVNPMTPTVGYSTNLPQMANATFTGATPDNVSSGVIAFQWQFIDGTGTILPVPYNLTSPAETTAPPGMSLPPTGPTPFWFDYLNPGATYNPRTLVVSLVVVSDNAYKLAVQTGTLHNLISQFQGAVPTTTVNGNTYDTETYAQYWSGLLNPTVGTFTVPGLPAPVTAAGSIQVFERHIPLPVISP